MRDTRLTASFTLAELVDLGEPGKADRWDLLTDERVGSLRRVAECLQVVRDHIGQPIRVTSGIRSGSGKSQHDHGQAADIQANAHTPDSLARIIWTLRGSMPHPLRQVIAETTRGPNGLHHPMTPGSGGWVHVAIQGPGFGPSRSPWLQTADGGRSYATWRP